jgi:hypothetical protein
VGKITSLQRHGSIDYTVTIDNDSDFFRASLNYRVKSLDDHCGRMGCGYGCFTLLARVF